MGGQELMSVREAERAATMRELASGRLRQRQAARRLGVSVRQVKRLLRRYRQDGAAGLASRRRGRPSNRKLPDAVRERALALVAKHYSDFGPTLAAEMLRERHAIVIGCETLRRWMIHAGLWRARPQRSTAVQQRRARRPRRGELTQIDGSLHDWFEGRAERCSLIVFIDDATSRLMAARFFQAETTAAYMRVLGEYLARHGRPLALYSDRHSIFQVNRPSAAQRPTQFGRALEELGIESIRAHSAPAKGRVERAFQTLQDRLVKAMRLDGVSSIKAGNEYLAKFVERHNGRFAVAPREAADEHLEVPFDEVQLSRILSRRTEHRLSKNLTFRERGREYQLLDSRRRRLHGRGAVLCEHLDGQTTVLVDGRAVEHRVFDDGARAPNIADDKTLESRVDAARQARRVRPAADHPWRQAARAAVQRRAALSGEAP